MSQFIDKCFKDKDGKLVLTQAPNKWLVLWIVFELLSMLTVMHSSVWFKVTAGLSNLFLVIWAGLEIVQGVNYFRRALGGVVLLVTLCSYVMLIKL